MCSAEGILQPVLIPGVSGPALSQPVTHHQDSCCILLPWVKMQKGLTCPQFTAVSVWKLGKKWHRGPWYMGIFEVGGRDGVWMLMTSSSTLCWTLVMLRSSSHGSQCAYLHFWFEQCYLNELLLLRDPDLSLKQQKMCFGCVPFKMNTETVWLLPQFQIYKMANL